MTPALPAGGVDQASQIARLGDEFDAVFPVPGDAERLWVIAALRQIVAKVEWLLPYLGKDVDGQLESLYRLTSAGLRPEQRNAIVTKMGGEFGVADAIIGVGDPWQSTGILALRGLFWLAVRRRRQTARPYRSAAGQIASALRAVVGLSEATPAAKALTEILHDLSAVSCLDDAIAVLDRLEEAGHKTLKSAWQTWFRPTLREVATEGSPIMPPRVPDGAGEEDSGEHIETLRLWPPSPRDLQPGEAPDETAKPEYVAMVPGYGTGALSRQQATYRARQAVWGRNSLLLTNHYEVLFPDVYAAALQQMITALRQLNTQGAETVGYIGCLLKAITGRTTRGILAIRLESSPALEPVAEPGLYLDLDAGVLSFPPYWKQPLDCPVSGGPTEAGREMLPSYFQPDDDNRELLLPVCDWIALPLVRPVREVLESHVWAIRRLCSVSDKDADHSIDAQAQVLAGTLGLPISSARLRCSLGALVMEQSGDLAMAQLICGDSFGRPSAQQHYYAPRRKDIAGVYEAVFANVFPQSATPALVRAAARVGSELLVRPEAARRLATDSLGGQFVTANDDGSRDSIVSAHRRMLDHLVRLILATTGHRWSSSLFEMTLRDFDTEAGMALFRDKRHDVAHDPRLVALPKVVCRQIEAYVRHVGQLAAAWPALRDDFCQLLRGEGPLLFDLRSVDGVWQLGVPELADIRERGPEVWRRLPENWGRTYIRTRALEMGAPAFLIACQLGHYDAVGYPFSNQSPTEPIDVVARLRPWLDRVAKTAGWEFLKAERLRQGARPKYGDAGIWPRLPLRDWTGDVMTASRRSKEAQASWQKALRANPRRARAQAREAVLDHPLLRESGISAIYRGTGIPPEVPSLADLDGYAVRQELLAGCGDDVAMALARVRALRHVLKKVAKLTGQPAPSVALPVPIRRPLDNAFFANACLANAQTQLMRRHVGERAKAHQPERSFELQVARTAEALVLFGGIEDAQTVLGLLGSRTRLRRSARIPDLLLVSLAEGRVIALRGVAALALANLADRFSEAAIPTRAVVDGALASILPAWACPSDTNGVLDRLCSTVAVANRFEYSPAARYAVDPEQGSASASVEEQLAFVDNDPVGPKRAVEAQSPPALHIHLPSQDRSRADPMIQYRRLCRMIPQDKQDYQSPIGDQKILAARIHEPATRAFVVNELDRWIKASDTGQGQMLCSIVRMLAGWTLSELQRRKANDEWLKYISVETYLTRIGRALVQELGDIDAARWTERLVEDAYGFAFEASKDAKHKVAAAILSFHRFAEAQFDLPEVDLAPVYAELRDGERHVDSAMILPVERTAALDALARDAWQNAGTDPDANRLARLADTVAPFLAYAGMRMSEPMGLQVADVGRRADGMLSVRIRSNRLRSLKTRAATRNAVFGPRFDQAALDRTWLWVTSMCKNAGARRPEGIYVISAPDTRNDLREQGAVGKVIRAALAGATHRVSERAHRLRHLVATERIAGVALSRTDTKWMELSEHPAAERALQPRDLHGISVPLGHAHWATTIQWYLHLPWVLQSRAAARLRDNYFLRATAAGALGLTPYELDNWQRGTSARNRVRTWFDHVCPARSVPVLPITGTPAPNAPKPWQWTAGCVGQLVSHAWRCKDLAVALRLAGIPMSEAERVRRVAERVEFKIGLRMIPEYIGGEKRQAPNRAMRILEAEKAWSMLWELHDRGTAEQRAAVSRAAFDYFTYLRSGDDIVLPKVTAEALCGLLHPSQHCVNGVPAYRLFLEDRAGGLVTLRVEPQTVPGMPTRHYGARGLKRVLAMLALVVELRSSDVCGSSSALNLSDP